MKKLIQITFYAFALKMKINNMKNAIFVDKMNLLQVIIIAIVRNTLNQFLFVIIVLNKN
jgi:hypothetical protein